jgi:hypothetical protein
MNKEDGGNAMDNTQGGNEPTNQELPRHAGAEAAVLPYQGDILDPRFWRKFLALTGGSVFYCVSAIFVAYGIVKVLGPILAGSITLVKAMPCIATLHVYELALLGVLILIVSRKVVDDAVSLAILMTLFLVGTSIAQGSVAERSISISLLVAGAGVALAIVKLCCMRRFAGIAFGWLSVSGLAILMAANYIGPAFLARSVSISPAAEQARRELWMFLWVVLLVAGGIVLIESLKRGSEEGRTRPFLQRPAMACVLAFILLAASGVQQYAMAYTFALERLIGDFAPLVTLGALLLMAILRSLGKRFGFIEVITACLPLAAMMWAIESAEVSSSGQWSLGLIAYPPVFFALSGLAMTVVALYKRWYSLLYVVFFYGMGVVLTWGYSRANPHALNISATLWATAISLICYGLTRRNQFPYLAGVITLCVQVTRIASFAAFAKSHALSEMGIIAGIFGIGIMAFYLVFGQRMEKALRMVGTLCLAGFLYDYMPSDIHWRHAIAILGTGSLVAVLWFKYKDAALIAILSVPFLIKLYVVTRCLGYWRAVILGFLLLAAGALASLRKPGPQDDIHGPDAA